VAGLACDGGGVRGVLLGVAPSVDCGACTGATGAHDSPANTQTQLSLWPGLNGTGCLERSVTPAVPLPYVSRT